MTSRHNRSVQAMPIRKALLTLPPSRPRNPLVAAALLRQAGAHRPGRGAIRAAERRSLRAEVLDHARRDRPAGDP